MFESFHKMASMKFYFLKGEDMFYNDWVLLRLAEERRRDLMQQLEQEKVARLARSVRRPRERWLYRALDQIGQELVVIGEHLQSRHKAAMTAAALHAAYRAQSTTRTQRG